MSCVIVIRKARPDDEPARAALIRDSYAGFNRDAFFLFFFQELTLEVGVLAGAVLFIFFGVSLTGLLLLVPALAAVVEVAVRVTHAALADKKVQEMRKEVLGFVAEYRGPLVSDASRVKPAVIAEEDWNPQDDVLVHTRVVGTVSVSEFWGPDNEGWLYGLAVHTDWQRRGAGRALVLAALRAPHRYLALHATHSGVQTAAGHTLRSARFTPRGAYHRRLCGAALTLAVSHVAATVSEHV